MEPTDFKNVIIENIHWALSEDAEVAEWISFQITFLKSVASTDQNENEL